MLSRVNRNKYILVSFLGSKSYDNEFNFLHVTVYILNYRIICGVRICDPVGCVKCHNEEANIFKLNFMEK